MRATTLTRPGPVRQAQRIGDPSTRRAAHARRSLKRKGPNQGAGHCLLRVDLAGLRKAGYEIPKVTRVGRSFNMPGGDYELQFPYEVPPEYISVVSR
jgi:hypothetical protein